MLDIKNKRDTIVIVKTLDKPDIGFYREVKVTDTEILHDHRFRVAIQREECTRAVAIFLRLKFPSVEHLESLPKEERNEAIDYVVTATLEKQELDKEIEKEMR